jgi:hypothetical protein
MMGIPWLKIEHTTPDKPEVEHIADELGIHPLHAFGLCFVFWRWCDAHLRDGHYLGGTLDKVDRHVHHAGFAEAILQSGWIQLEDDRIIVTHFLKHLGDSAKSRASGAKRKENSRTKKCVTKKCDKSVTNS